jgi:hypothetical protein
MPGIDTEAVRRRADKRTHDDQMSSRKEGV